VIAAMVLGLAAVLVFVTAIRVPAQTPGPGWIRGAARSVIRAQGVVLVEEAHAFLVDTGGAIPLAVSTRSPQLGETVIYCRTSGWFEDPMHGSKFDPLGRYTVGPAPRGLDRFAVRVLDGVAWIDSAAVTPGPPRGSPTTAPAGAFCAT
jgi:cytochrome b6-f complex iron-sulfur subunit